MRLKTVPIVQRELQGGKLYVHSLIASSSFARLQLNRKKMCFVKYHEKLCEGWIEE